jgi:hypothetical protein
MPPIRAIFMNNHIGFGTTLTERPTARPMAEAMSSAPRTYGPVGR